MRVAQMHNVGCKSWWYGLLAVCIKPWLVYFSKPARFRPPKLPYRTECVVTDLCGTERDYYDTRYT